MEKQLPKNWVECSLGEIIKTKKGKKPNSTIDYPKEGYVPYILIDEMEGKPIRSYTNDPNVSIASEDEVLLVWDGSIGKCGSGINGAIGSTLVALKPMSNIPTKFIEYILINKNSYIKQTSTGTGLQHINKDFFKNCFIGLPPLSEQIRIVAKLDALFVQLDSIKESMINVPLLLKDFRQEVLKQAVNGKLTEDFRIKHGPFENAMLFVDRIKTKKELVKNISNNLPENWVKVRIGEMFHVVRGSSPRPKGDPKYFSDKRTNFHWIMLSDFTKNAKENMLIDTNEFLTEEGSKLSRYVCKDDLLIGASGVYGVGRTCFLDIDGYIYDGIMAIKSIKNHSLKMFMNYFMQLQRMNFMKIATGTSWPNINTDILNKYEFPIPPIDEQLEIVSRIESLFAKADIIEQQYKVLKNKIDNLPQAILQKAFKGELTEQWESDGDAIELLQEILELKGATTKVAKNTKLEKLKSFNKMKKKYSQSEGVLVTEGK